MTSAQPTIIPATEKLPVDPPADASDRWARFDWKLIPGVPRPPHMNMALDEVLTLRVGSGLRQPTIRIWKWDRKAIVLGRFQSVRNEVDEEAAAANDITITRRISGGGAMFIEPDGAITWSIHAPEAIVDGLTFPESYAFFDGFIVDALRGLGVDAWYAPLNDITSAGGKLGGAAQARRGGAVLHHTTMAYAMNTTLMAQVLRVGKEKLSDKGISSAAKRVSAIQAQTGLDRDGLIDALFGHFSARYRVSPDEVTADELAEAERLVESRFSTRPWTHFLP
ncbi:MAG TPA: biotin/lipoate A/B protein ligase family protein [Thermomicrobiales bacterium]|jgi:lipoate-protein ligase A|nr:biotin/lipoate A/B protein ligase family protein [Thermomicrobiales bacterium]